MSIRNFSTYFWKKFEAHKERIAFVEATSEGVQPVTFWQWTRDVQKLAMGLLDAGFEPGQRMAIVAHGGRAWLDVAFAVWLNGGVVVPLVPGRERRESLRCLARAGCEWIAADSHKGLDAIRGQGDKLPDHLRWLSFEAMRVGSPGANTLEVPALSASGKDLLKRGKLDQLAKRTYELEADAPAIVLYPFDPSDDPHGAYYSGGKLAVQLEALGADLQLEDDERLAPVLSLGWFPGVLVTLATLLCGRTVVTANTPRELEERFNELQPTLLLVGPAWLEGQALAWRARLEQAPQFLKNIERPSGLGRALATLGASAARAVLYDPIHRDLGGKVSRIYLVGGHAPDEVLDVLAEAKLPLLGIWGLPECGVCHLERRGAERRGSVGRPVQGYVCKIDGARTEQEHGEVLVRSDVLFDGYWDNQGPREIRDDYLMTGVRGHLETGFLLLE